MSSSKINENAKSKLAGLTLDKTEHNDSNKFIKRKRNAIHTKSLRLREYDLQNLNVIIKTVNEHSLRKDYSESEVIRGIINMAAKELNIKKLLLNIAGSK